MCYTPQGGAIEGNAADDAFLEAGFMEVTLSLKPWKIISTKRDELIKFFKLRTDRAVSPRTNIPHDFYVLESAGWVNVIPVTPEEDVILIRQYRHGIQGFTLEIPGGIIEPGDSPEGAASRELFEETGYREREMIFLGSVHANPAILNNTCYTYLAKGVYPAGKQELDDKEDIEVVIKPLKDIPRLIKEGEITHSLILAAFYRFFMEYDRRSSEAKL
jgi:ADP-ribose pyrophosphatase